MSSIRRRLMSQVASDQNALPAGCVKCEYIEANGAQWINTEYIPKRGCEIDIYNVQFKTGNLVHIISAFDGNYQLAIAAHQKNLNDVYYKYFATGSAVILHYDVRQKFDVHISSDGTLDISGNTVKSNPTGYINTPLFYLKAANDTTFYIGLVGELVISEGGVEVVHLIPILDANGEPCFYDVVRKKYYRNQGTGTFLYKIAE